MPPPAATGRACAETLASGTRDIVGGDEGSEGRVKEREHTNFALTDKFRDPTPRHARRPLPLRLKLVDALLRDAGRWPRRVRTRSLKMICGSCAACLNGSRTLRQSTRLSASSSRSSTAARSCRCSKRVRGWGRRRGGERPRVGGGGRSGGVRFYGAALYWGGVCACRSCFCVCNGRRCTVTLIAEPALSRMGEERLRCDAIHAHDECCTVTYPPRDPTFYFADPEAVKIVDETGVELPMEVVCVSVATATPARTLRPRF